MILKKNEQLPLLVRTSTGKQAFTYKIDHNTGLVRISYCASERLADIHISKIEPWPETVK